MGLASISECSYKAINLACQALELYPNFSTVLSTVLW